MKSLRLAVLTLALSAPALAQTTVVCCNNGTSSDSPTFTGDPQAPTAARGDNDDSVATTEFVNAATLPSVEIHGVDCADNATDDAPALSAAIVAMAHSGRRVPADCTININSTVQVTTSNWHLAGDGSGWGTTNGPYVKINGNITGFALGDSSTIVEGIRIEGLKFFGVAGGTSQHAFDLSYVKNSHWIYAFFNGFTAPAIIAQSGGVGSGFYNNFTYCWFTANVGPTVYHTKGAAGLAFRHSFWGNNTVGAGYNAADIDISGVWNFVCDFCDFETSAVTREVTAAVHMSGVLGARFENSHFETPSGVWCNAFAWDVCPSAVFENNSFTTGVAATSIWGNGWTKARVSGNHQSLPSGSIAFKSTNATGGNVVTGNVYSAGVTNVLQPTDIDMDTIGRFRADFTSGTLLSRYAIQSITTNGATSFSVLPNGTSTASGVDTYSNSDPTNASVMRIGIDGTAGFVDSAISGSGTLLPLRIRMNGTTAIGVGTTGNVGIPTPSATAGVLLSGSASLNGAATFEVANTSSSDLNALGRVSAKADTSSAFMQAHGSGRTATGYGVNLAGYAEVIGATGNGLLVGTSIATPVIFGSNRQSAMTINTSNNLLVTNSIASINGIATAGSTGGVAPVVGSVSLSGQSATVAATNVVTAAAAGMYRVCWMTQVTTPATTSSSVVVTVGWNNGSAKTSTVGSVDGAVSVASATPSNTLNSTASGCAVVTSAAAQAITYTATYASSGATAMQYALRVVAERLQ